MHRLRTYNVTKIHFGNSLSVTKHLQVFQLFEHITSPLYGVYSKNSTNCWRVVAFRAVWAYNYFVISFMVLEIPLDPLNGSEATLKDAGKRFLWIREEHTKKYIVGLALYNPDSKVHVANMGPTWGRQDPGGPHVGPMNFAIREFIFSCRKPATGDDSYGTLCDTVRARLSNDM